MLWLIAPIIVISNVYCVLYCIKPKPGSLYSKIRKAILYDLFSKLGSIIASIIGPKPMQWFRKFKHYLINTNNPLTQIFYILLFPGAYTMFIFCLLIPYHVVYSIWDHLVGHSLVMFGFYMYYKTCVTNPGFITSSNAKFYVKKHIEYQEGSLFRKENCSTCCVPKPARSKHCRICDKCISKLDHHCIWIRGCVGEHNYKYFLGFISSHSVMCFFGSYISIKCLDFVVYDLNLWNLKFQSGSGKIMKASFWIIFRYLFDNYEIPMFLFLLCTVLAFALLGFCLYHLTLIRKGASMSEAGKLADFSDKLKRTKEDFEKRVDKYKENFPNYETDEKMKKKMQFEMRKKFDKEWKDFQNELNIVIRNYHSKTFMKTFKEILRA